MDLKRLSLNLIFLACCKSTVKGKDVTMTKKPVEVELPLIFVSLATTLRASLWYSVIIKNHSP